MGKRINKRNISIAKFNRILDKECLFKQFQKLGVVTLKSAVIQAIFKVLNSEFLELQKLNRYVTQEKEVMIPFTERKVSFGTLRLKSL